MRERRVPTRDSLNRSFEMQETFFLDRRGKFGAKSVCEWSLMGNYHSAGFLDRLE